MSPVRTEGGLAHRCSGPQGWPSAIPGGRWDRTL